MIYWYIKKSILLIVVTVFYFSVLSFIQYPEFNIIFAIVLSFFLIAIPNLIFLLLLCLSNRKYRIYFTFQLIIFEVILLYLINFILNRAIDFIPYEYRYKVTPLRTSINRFFTSPFIELYQYLILFFILFLLRDFFIKKIGALPNLK
jgi:hypothetical protein